MKNILAIIFAIVSITVSQTEHKKHIKIEGNHHSLVFYNDYHKSTDHTIEGNK